MSAAGIVAVMALGTIALRFLPVQSDILLSKHLIQKARTGLRQYR